MKNYLLFGFALATVLASCTQSEVMETAVETPMTFSAFVNKATKAPITDMTNVSFGVWGYKTKTGETAATPVAVFASQATNNGAQTVSYTTSWVYTPLRYWDQTCSYMFYAYAPVEDGVTASQDADYKITVTDFTVNSTIANQIDLLIADPVSRAAKETTAVGFTFKHVLTKVNLNVTTSLESPQEVKLVSAKIYGMNDKGTYTDGTWESSLNDNDFSFTFNTETALSSTATSVFSDLLMIPQTFTTEKALNLDLNYTINGETFTKTVSLGTTAWAKNTNITYTLTIGPNAITFDTPTISDWDTKSEGVTIN